jgi:hypothetical protein
MAVIYAADVFCDDCADEIRLNVLRELRRADGLVTPVGFVYGSDGWEFSFDPDDERDYDSDEYPKHCSDDEESDCPQHCGSHEDCVNAEVLSDGSKVGYFFGNELTTDGADYVRNAVREDIESGDTDSVACAIWYDGYGWIDWEDIGRCDVCAALAILSEDYAGNFVCVECED